MRPLLLDVDDLFAKRAAWRVFRTMELFVWIVTQFFENALRDGETMTHAQSNKRTDIICIALLSFLLLIYHHITALRFPILYCMQFFPMFIGIMSYSQFKQSASFRQGDKHNLNKLKLFACINIRKLLFLVSQFAQN